MSKINEVEKSNNSLSDTTENNTENEMASNTALSSMVFGLLRFNMRRACSR